MADTIEQTVETHCLGTKVFETLHAIHSSSVQSLLCRPTPGAEEVVVNPRRPGQHTVSIVGLVSWLAVALLAIALFAADLVGVEDGVIGAEDRSFDLWIHSALGPPSYPFFELMTALGSTIAHIVAVAIVVLVLVVLRLWATVILVVVAEGGAALMEELVKLVVARPRPRLFHHVVAASGPSFPSGHATNAIALAIVVIFLVWRFTQRHDLTALTAVVALTYAALVGLSRLVLGVHYPTDVLGGFALGAAWLCAVIALPIWGHDTFPLSKDRAPPPTRQPQSRKDTGPRALT